MERSRTVRNRNTKRIARYVSSMRFASRLSSNPTPTTARPEGVAAMPAGGLVSARMPRTTGASVSKDPGPVRKTMLNACPPSLTVERFTSAGATS